MRHLTAALAVLGLAVPALSDNWPAWRGPTGDGRCAEKNLPLKWAKDDNVRWRVPLSDPGHSTPVIWGERLFLTQSNKDGSKRSVLCFSTSDGKLLWQRDTEYKEKEPTHATNPYCSASPANDGERVVASLGSAGMVCYDLDGKELWRKDVGPMRHAWGNASSPVLWGDLCILWIGPGKVQKLLAVDRKSGQNVWEHDEPGGKAEETRPFIGSWSTPAVVRVGDHDELILPVPGKVKGFDPENGKELWSCEGVRNPSNDLLAYATVVTADGVAVALGGFNGSILAVKPGGSGDVTEKQRLWYLPRGNRQMIGSPVISGEHVFIIDEPGTARCLELKTGKEVGKLDRIGGTTWSSPILSEGRLYIPTMTGDVVVLSADPKLEVLARNKMGEPIYASPAVSDGAIFIRTHKALWCVGPKK
jgi:outer membrane protein assembly factor BamB